MKVTINLYLLIAKAAWGVSSFFFVTPCRFPFTVISKGLQKESNIYKQLILLTEVRTYIIMYMSHPNDSGSSAQIIPLGEGCQSFRCAWSKIIVLSALISGSCG